MTDGTHHTQRNSRGKPMNRRLIHSLMGMACAIAPFAIAAASPAQAQTVMRPANDLNISIGRGQLVIFDPSLTRQSQERLSSSGALRRALAAGTVVPYYQPVVDLGTGVVVGVEALARWTDPDLGPVPAEVLVRTAEASGQILELGAQILERSCADAKTWLAAGRRLQMAGNISAAQLRDPGISSMVLRILRLTGLPATQLTLEITESQEVADLRSIDRALGLMRHQGVTFSVDDFGTGYSSLLLLQSLPVETLKIDRAFVAGLGTSGTDEQIVAGIVAMTNAIGHRSVAEGIETEAQMRALQQMGCQFGQGYLWSPAVPAEALLGVIEAIESVPRITASR